MTLPRIIDIFSAQAEQIPSSTAFLGLDKPPLTYKRLYEHVCNTVRTLNSMGLGRNDRIGLVLSQGPEHAVAALTLMACASCVPLNPTLREDEFALRFSGIRIKCLIVEAGLETPAREVAQTQGIPIIELSPVRDAEAGIFTLAGSGPAGSAAAGFSA